MSITNTIEMTTGNRLINSETSTVIDAITGLIISDPRIGLLDIAKVIVRRDYLTLKGVKIISGGASGHEPAHAGFVGQGMLTAAVQGELFSSPTTRDILRTIRELSFTDDSDILLIIQNNTSDRLNFGLAMERARNEGISVKMLVVAEDCNVTDEQKGRRGLSGIILMHKIAGAMADLGMDFLDIFSFCCDTQQQMSTALVCLKSITSINVKTCICGKHLGTNEIELGAGLHGEPGAKRLKLATAQEVCSTLLNELTRNDSPHALALSSSVPVVVLINNLGVTSRLEEYIFLKESVQLLQSMQITVLRVYSGRFLTSLDMMGFSVTILNVFNDKVIQYLDHPCSTIAWNNVNVLDINPSAHKPIRSKFREDKQHLPAVKGFQFDDYQANNVQMIIQFACDALVTCEKQLNIIDADLGDGDTGSTLKRGAEAILQEIKKHNLDLHYPFMFLESMSKIVEQAMGGTLGCIYSILFEAGSTAFLNLPDEGVVLGDVWLNALVAANEAVKRYTNAEVGYRTMYDPLYACATTMKENLRENISHLDAYGAGVLSAEEAAHKTKSPFRYPDPGAFAVALWLRAVYEALRL